MPEKMNRLCLTLALLCGLLVTPSVHAFSHHHHKDELPDYDKRNGAAEVPLVRKNAVEQLKQAVPSVAVDFHKITHTPRFVSAKEGFLTGKNGRGRGLPGDAVAGFAPNDPHRVTKAFLKEHKELFGHGPEALADAQVKREFVGKHNGLRTVVWQQQVDGIPVFQGLLISHTTKAAELVNISSRFVARPAQAAEAASNKGLIHSAPISAAKAIAIAARDLGEEVKEGDIIPKGDPAGPKKRQQFKAAGLEGAADTQLVWLPMSENELRLCWQVVLTSEERMEMFRVLVDAETGETLVRHSLTRYAMEGSYRVFVSDSPSPFSPGHPFPTNTQPPIVSRELITLTSRSTNASPNGWLSTNETIGNNVNAFRPGHSRPQGTSNVFDFPIDFGSSPFNSTPASVTHLFYWCNWMHDRLYDLGFTEEAGNFQADNFGRGGIGGDALVAKAQDNVVGPFINLPWDDGTAPELRMGLSTGSSPDRDTALDTEIILHEYTHGMSDRLVGGGEGLTASQSKGLGEGWSDFYALALLSETGDVANGVYPLAGYSTYHDSFLPSFEQNYYFGIRRYPYSTDMSKNPLTFKDIDGSQANPHAGIPKNPLNAGSQVHRDGEVWCSALWEARANLIAKYGFSIGNEVILQLVTDGMILSPPNPNFVEARDAILQADLVGNSGANHSELWAAFAKRGLGYFATSPEGTTASGVVESFALPDQLSISPVNAFVSSGLEAGPFWPLEESYTLTNVSTNTVIGWSLAKTSLWLNVSATNGTLPATTATNVVFSLNLGVAYGLPSGIYTEDVAFTNQTSGLVQSRRFTLRVGQMDYFTEEFPVADFDLGNQTLTFTPNGSQNFYSVCRESVTNFSTDPTGGTAVVFTNSGAINRDDGFMQVTVSTNVSLYGTSTNKFFIGSNGYLTFGSGDAFYEPSLQTHMNRLRISAFFTDLDLTFRGSVSWKQTNDRVAVTYLGVPQRGTARTNNFQIELFFDGKIQLTWLEMKSHIGLVGLSRGTGVAGDYFESDLSGYSECIPPIIVTSPYSASESDGILIEQGAVTLPAPLATNITIALYSSDVSEVTVPESVLIPAGQTNTTFDITVVDDVDLDGTQMPLIVALAPGFESARSSILVHDNESGFLSVTLPENVNEGDVSVEGMVDVDEAVADDVVVYLVSDNTNELQVPVSVIIPAGETTVFFPATIIDDNRIDGPQTAGITAHVENWTDGLDSVSILDNESTALTVVAPSTAREGNGVLPDAGIVSISGTLTSNLVISLDSSLLSAATVPGTVTILAGNTFALFDITVINDALLDGVEMTEIIAGASGFSGGSAELTVTDDEMPLVPMSPTPAHLDANVPSTTDLSWSVAAEEGEEQLENGGFETGTVLNWTTQTHSNASFTLNQGAAVLPFSGYFNLLMEQTGAGTQVLYQDVSIPVAQVATLSWADRIINSAGEFNSNQQFRVELRTTNNATLAVLFSTPSGFNAPSEWSERTANISEYRGQTVRVTFVLQVAAAPFDVHLDAISLRVGSPPLTTYDVYFGTNETLGAGELLGSTTNTSWDLQTLEPLMTYYWQIVAHRTGTMTGPTWQFTTVPQISIGDVTVTEADETIIAEFPVTLSSPSSQMVVVTFSTQDGSAVATEDYIAQTETALFFAPGETSNIVTITINGDSAYEIDETFFVTLSNPQQATIADANGMCTILNDDPFLALIPDVTIDEGEAFTFTAQAGIVGPPEIVMIADFENFGLPPNDTVLFRKPKNSSTTAAYLNTTPDFSVVTNLFPSGNSSTRVLHTSWSFTSNTNAWLRLTTANAQSLPNPTVDFNQVIKFKVFTDRPLRMGMALRETGTSAEVGDDGGLSGGIEHVGVTNKSVVGKPMPVRTLATGVWQTVSFELPQEPLTPFAGTSANGILFSDTGLSNKGVLEHLSFVPVVPTNGAGIYNVYLDNLELIYSNALSFSLSNAPAGATIHPQTGVFNWTPSEVQAPGVYTITVHVAENTPSGRTGIRTFTVTVNEVNSQPSFPFISDKSTGELQLLSFNANATDPDLPANTLSYRLDLNAPEGAAIHAQTGEFTWTPSEAQGPGIYSVTIYVDDDGDPAATFSRTFWITVNETNSAPVLSPISYKQVYANEVISFFASAIDPDYPANSLSFNFAAPAPAGASVDPLTGEFYWQPTMANVPSTNSISIRVTDNGSPQLSDIKTFNIFVLPAPRVQGAVISGDQFHLTWPSIPGRTYRVEYKDDLDAIEWWPLPEDVVAEGFTATKSDYISGIPQRFYRIIVVE
jgi:hypothetical protein